jgi:hypothetical protein
MYEGVPRVGELKLHSVVLDSCQKQPVLMPLSIRFSMWIVFWNSEC